MDGQQPPLQPQRPPQKNMRSSVSMFIEDSKITAVANAVPPPPSVQPSSAPASSFYSVTSFSSASTPTPSSSPLFLSSRRSSFNLRQPFRQIPESGNTINGIPSGEGASIRRACSSSPVRFPGARNSGRGGSASHERFQNTISEGGDTTTTTSQFRPPPPSSIVRRTTLSVEPVVSIINVRERPPLPLRFRDDRAFTSVQLSLRSPTSSDPSGIVGPTLVTSTSTSTSGGGGFGADFTEECSGGGGINLVKTVVDMEAGATSFRHVHSTGGSEGSTSTCGEINHHLHHHHHHPSTNLMYSTYSNSKDGFEAQVQIQFGPNGGTFTASRRRRNTVSVVRQMNSGKIKCNVCRVNV